jgi:glycosyltransferase involved in cell wall biosynthesis
MRILAVTNLYPNPYEPGRAAFNRHQLVALGRQHAVRVIAPVPWTTVLAARLKGRAPAVSERGGDADGIRVEHPWFYYTPALLRRWHGPFYRWSVSQEFRRAVRDHSPDVVLGTWAYPDGWAAVKLARSANLPVVIKVHGCDVLCGGRGLESDPPRMRRTVEALRGADGVVAVSRHLAEKVVSLGVPESRIRVVYSGVDRTVFHAGPVEQARRALGLDLAQPLIVFVGRLDAVKGIDVLLDACARLITAGRRFKCCLVGDGELRRRLEQRILTLGISQTVQMMGARPQRQLGDWYRAADFVVVPSHSEGVPGVLLEAAACGTPFIASRVGGIPEIADLVPSVLVPTGDADALARAIGERLDTPFGLRRVPQQMRDHAGSAEQLGGFLAEVVARAGGRMTAEAAAPGRPEVAIRGVGVACQAEHA